MLVKLSVNEETLNYYEKNADEFVKNTINADMGFNRGKYALSAQ